MWPRWWYAALVVLAGCGSSSHAPAPPSEAPVLLRADRSFDGADVVLRRDGTLTVGAHRGTAEIPDADAYFLEHQAALRIVSIDARTRGVLLALPIEGSEDPPNRYQLFVIEGQSLRRVLDLTTGGYGVTELRFPGDGSARYVEDGWTACEREGHDRTDVPLDEVVLRRGSSGTFEVAERVRSGSSQDCTMLAACPYVYVLSEGHATLVGEILRDVRGVDAYAEQTLALPTLQATTLHVRLAEEKEEITYLDAIRVLVDGVPIAPRACDDAAPPAYCASDREPHVLRPGESLELVFDVPPGERTLWASGQYVPAPTLHTRQ